MTDAANPEAANPEAAVPDSATPDAPEFNDTTRGWVRVWDPLVRVFHWGLVVAYALAWLSAEELDALHEAAGYAIAGLVAVRVVWGFVGSRHARFARFVKGPGQTLDYVKGVVAGRERRYLGHNPAGAVMIVALLVSLAGVSYTGWLMAGPGRIAMVPDLPQIVAPAHADEDGDGDGDGDDHGEGRGYGEGGAERVEDLHEVFANLTLLLVVLHVGGVVLASVRHRENLASAMVTGRKRAPGPDDIA